MTDLRSAAQQALEAHANRYQVVRDGYWWRVKIGDGTQTVGQHHTETGALRLASELHRAFHDGGFVVQEALKAALEQPEQEPVPKSTWQKLYEAAIDQRNEAVAELRRLHAENVLLHERHHFDNGVLAELLQALKEATDAIEHWGSYSSDYFQQKWDLHSDINAARAAIARAEGKI